MKLRKLWPLVGALCLGLTSTVFGHSNSQNGTGSSTYGMSTDTSSSQANYQRGTFREITPNAGPRVAHGADVFITADFIWWGVNQNGLNYGTTVDNLFSPANDPFKDSPQETVASVGRDWAPGFKVGLGLNLGHDGWDLYAQYTWLHASDSQSITASSTGTILFSPLTPNINALGQLNPSFFGSKASSNWNLHFNVIDLELGRNFYLSQFLTMRPFIGLKGTWQDQNWNVTLQDSSYTCPLDNQTTFTINGPWKNKTSTDMWGLGVRGGFNVAWYMAKNWSIYSDLAFTTMWTKYHKVDIKNSITDAATGDTKLFAYLSHDTIYTVRLIAELELGLRWETWFYDDNYHFAIQAGWEEQVWVNWGTFQELWDQGTYDLSLHGLNLKFRFDF